MDSSWKFLVFSFTTFTFLLTLAEPKTKLLRHICSKSNGYFTKNSTYEANLNSLLSSFSSNITPNDYGFYNISSGQGSDAANGIALCRGDKNSDACLRCIKNATTVLKNRCPNQTEAIIWYDLCIFRYTNRSIFGVAEMEPHFIMRNPYNVTDGEAFNQALSDLLDSLISKTSEGNSHLKFATGSALQTIRALVQCTPDLNSTQCSSCLNKYLSYTPQCCDRRQGGRVLGPSCNFRFEIYDFYNHTAVDTPLRSPPPPTPLLSPLPSTKGNKSISSRNVIIITFLAVAFAALLISSCIYFILREKKSKVKLQTKEPGDKIGNAECLQYDFSIIKVATDNFSDANKLGQGGFGAVYKGKLASGELIAVKRLAIGSGQGDLEFKNEVQLVAQLQHRNLVKLRGFCIERNERLLIYEFVNNGSLDQLLFDPLKRANLDWERRYKIIGGIARGLLYLHEDSRLRIIHRDLKASNVLLDAEMNPKISDFGMARLCSLDQTLDTTSKIAGTYGYMAPEYAMNGQISAKSDVFSFGVLVLEILSGQKNSAFRNGENVEDLLSYAWKNWRDGTALNVVDPPMRDGSTTELMRCIHIGLSCVQENVAPRPNMASVVLMLTSYSVSLPLPSKPAFFMDSKTQSTNTVGLESLNSDTTESNQTENNEVATLVSKNDVSITELCPR